MRMPWPALLTAALLLPAPALAQSGTAEIRAHSYGVLLRRLDHYVDPARKPAILAALEANRTRLLAAPDDAAFMAELNKLLFAASNDKHLMVFQKGPNPPAADDAQVGDWGVAKVARLPGNVALVELTGFSNAPESVAAIDAAMDKVRGAKALVLDLRANGGGGETSFLRLLGHLFPKKTDITAIEWRECAPPPPDRPDACRQTAPRLERRFTNAPPAPAFARGPVYVLVSKASFSAAEALAYELQAHGRARIIGERTGGGGNPSAGMDLESDFVVIMPIGRMKPVNGTGWEGKGVTPDIAAPAAQALDRALSESKRR